MAEVTMPVNQSVFVDVPYVHNAAENARDTPRLDIRIEYKLFTFDSASDSSPHIIVIRSSFASGFALKVRLATEKSLLKHQKVIRNS